MLMKYFTLTSIIHRASCSIDSLDGRDVLSFFIVCFYRGCSGRLPIFVIALSLEMYLAVFGAAQKYAGDFPHPI